MVLSLFFPKRCLSCRLVLESKGKDPLCTSCQESILWIKGPSCIQCGQPFESEDAVPHACNTCETQKTHFEKGASLFYYEGAIVEMMHQWKYGKREGIGRHFGSMLAAKRDILDADFLIPIPMTTKRLRERGFNQSQQIAKILGQNLNRFTELGVLRRNKSWKGAESQTGLSRANRLKNVRGAFIISKKKRVYGKNLLLIDDVYTTGATIREAARILKKEGAKSVNFLTMARVR
jgi:ComF family protein